MPSKERGEQGEGEESKSRAELCMRAQKNLPRACFIENKTAGRDKERERKRARNEVGVYAEGYVQTALDGKNMGGEFSTRAGTTLGE